MLDPDALRLARMASRRILGFMNDTALTSRRIIERAGGLQHVVGVLKWRQAAA